MRVKKVLNEHEVWHRIVDKDAMGEDVDGVVKTIVMKVGDAFHSVCVDKDHLVDWDKIKAYCGSDSARLADEDEVVAVSGSKPGGCCPLLVSSPVIFDPSVLEYDRVHMGSGHKKFGLEMNMQDVVEIVDPDVARVSRKKE